MGKTKIDTETRRLQKELESKLGWGSARQWHSSMFAELSEKIFDETQVNISSATLKRFFGVVKHDGLPSTSTLDYLSQFLGYENWRAFKLSKRAGSKPITRTVSSKAIYISIGFVLALITIMVIANKSPEPVELPDDISFTSKPVTTTYPNSVVFDFDLKGIDADSIHIQQYWDPTKTITIKKDQTQATGIYYFPGYFRAKLLIDGQVVKEHDLFLKSNGWLGTIEYKPVPKYFEPVSTEGFKISSPARLATEIALSEKPQVTGYHYINDLGVVSGDDFTLTTTLRNTYDDKWAVCQAIRIYDIGSDGAMIIPFSKPGCSSDNNLMLNDIYLDGKEHDLSAFSVELDDFIPIKVRNKGKKLTVQIKGKDVYSSSYNDTMGRLVGFRFKFLGQGEIRDLQLLDQNLNPVIL